MSAWGAGVCIFFRGRRCLGPPPPLMLNKELLEEVLGFPPSAGVPWHIQGVLHHHLTSLCPLRGGGVNHHQSSADGSVILPSMDAPGLSFEGSINRDYPMDISTNGA